MVNFIAAMIIIALVGGASFYLYRYKKHGGRCIGCSASGECPKHHGVCNCNKDENPA